MTTDFSLMDIAGNFTGMGPAVPDESTGMMSTATTGAVVTPQVTEKKTGFVNPKLALKTEPVAPVADQAAYNASIAQQESGGNANIGFHNKNLSSAYGPYGMTTAAYADARKVNPSLPADITQASPEQQSQAQNAFTQQNAGYLKNYGIPVNESTLSAAHLLGAKGLKDYQDTGYLSPAAIKANGGEANLRNIVEARLGGQAGPASGAVQPAAPAPAAPVPTTAVSPEQAAPPPAPAEQAYTGGGLKTPGGQTQAQLQQEQGYHSVLNSNSQQEIGKLAFDMNTPKDVQRAALDKLQNTMAIEDGMRRAQTIASKLGENPTPQALNKAMNDKDTGSYFKVLMYQALGWTSKAKQELNKIDPEVTYTGITMPDGQNYNVKYNKDTGQVMTAWDSQGQMITDTAKLGEIAAGGVNPATAKSFLMPQTAGSPVTKTVNGQVINGIQIYDPVRKAFYVQYGNQRDMNPQGWTSASQNVEQQETLARMRGGVKIETLRSELTERIRAKPVEEANKIITEHNTKYADNIPLQQYTPGGPTLQAKPQAAPTAVAPQGGAAVAPVVPGTPAATGQVPAAPAPAPAPAVSGGRRPGESIKDYEDRLALEQSTKKISTEAPAKAEAEGRKKLVDESTKILTQIPDLNKFTKDITRAETILDSGNHNIGPYASVILGSGPIAQAIGGNLPIPTKDSINTNQIMATVQRIATDGIKVLGSNPSTKDLEFWVKNKPNETSSPDYVKQWLADAKENIQNRIEFHKGVVKNKGVIPGTESTPETVTPTAPATPAINQPAPGTRKTIPGRGTFEFDGKGWKPV